MKNFKKTAAILTLSAISAATLFGFTACDNGDGDSSTWVNTYKISNPSNAKKPIGTKEYDSFMKIDGVLDEEAYKTQKWLEAIVKINSVQSAEVKMTTIVTEKGLYVAADVTEHNTKIYYNPDRANYINSCIEFYLTLEGQKSVYDKGSFEIDMTAGNDLTMRIRTTDWTELTTVSNKMPAYAATTKGGDVNTDEAYGYYCELFIPFTYLDFADIPYPENHEDMRVRINPVHISSLNYEGTNYKIDRSYNEITGNDFLDYSWSDPPTWYSFDKDGLCCFTYNVTQNGKTNLGTIARRGAGTALFEGRTATFDVVCKNGSHLKTLTVNGVDMKAAVDFDSNNNGTLRVPNVTGDLDIVIEFER